MLEGKRDGARESHGDGDPFEMKGGFDEMKFALFSVHLILLS